MRTVLVLLLASTVSVFGQATAPRGAVLPKQLRDIGIEQRLGKQVPLDATFKDESGATVRLGDYFGKRPVLLVPVYYTCPMLCSQILSGVAAGLRPLSLEPGKDFEVVAFSFDPTNTPAEAQQKRDLYTRRYARDGNHAGWHFLTGPESSIQALTNAIGFHYQYDPATKMFLHASGVMMLTPDGKLSRYFYGVEYEPNDLRLGILESSKRKITSPVEQVLLFCYHYDPATGKYTPTVLNFLRVAAGLTVVGLLAGLVLFWRYDMRRYHALNSQGVKP